MRVGDASDSDGFSVAGRASLIWMEDAERRKSWLFVFVCKIGAHAFIVHKLNGHFVNWNWPSKYSRKGRFFGSKNPGAFVKSARPIHLNFQIGVCRAFSKRRWRALGW